jgi:hypothetical protein
MVVSSRHFCGVYRWGHKRKDLVKEYSANEGQSCHS